MKIFFLLLPILASCNLLLEVKDPPTSSSCGNGIIETGEECDNNLNQGDSCVSRGFAGGDLLCNENCTVDTTECIEFSPNCGNGLIDNTESCDGTNLDGADCSEFGFNGGTLRCSEICTYDTSLCTTENCGNELIDEGESCDSSNFGAVSCISLGFTGGYLVCSENCTLIDTSNCTEPSLCGNGLIDDSEGEECDGSELGENTCSSLGYYVDGPLTCDSECMFDRGNCSGGYCGDGIIQPFSPAFESCDGTSTSETCGDYGYWYGESGCTEHCYTDLSPCIDAISIAGGYNHTCVLNSIGEVYCWGDNYWGQLGDGGDVASSLTPVLALTSAPATKVVSGILSTCAMLTNNTVECWGYEFTPTPTLTSATINVSDLCMGDSHQCFTDNYGVGWCRGSNYDGQLGNGTIGGTETSPVQVSWLSDISTITCGESHTCAIANGYLYCWGNGAYGRLGTGSSDDEPYPNYIMGSVVDVSAGANHTCAIQSGGDLYCWGDSYYRQLAMNTSTDQFSPQFVGIDYVRISLKAYSSCGIKENGRVYCWGRNTYGDLGNNSTNQTYVQSQVNWPAQDVWKIGAGYYHHCAMDLYYGFQCWGYNNSGQIGNGNTNNSLSPTPVLPP
ncbi:hypothetical protein KKF34_15865 [Myxococcota bacterium]|nr:hypothetical protein [Myxococcota bacterium]MBU1381300.1 hypothetical protein [Myxococcota bacterium]MBU1498353.1 hypothetical protein [Myxococcota bacterium]